MTLMSVGSAVADPFLFESVGTDSMIAGNGDGAGPVALTCNCYGSCGPGLCSGHCCSLTPRITILEI